MPTPVWRSRGATRRARITLALAAAAFAACRRDPEPDAYGNFEAT